MHDSAFARVYLEEKRLLLERLTEADQRLLALARMQAQARLLVLHNVGGELTAPAGTASDNHNNC